MLLWLMNLGFAGGGTVATTTTNNYAGGWTQHLWIAHINGKRYVGTYEEIQDIAEGIVEKTEKKPRIVIKALRKSPEGATVHREIAAPEAKRVQQQLTLDIGMFLSALMEKRRRDDEDDIEILLLI